MWPAIDAVISAFASGDAKFLHAFRRYFPTCGQIFLPAAQNIKMWVTIGAIIAALVLFCVLLGCGITFERC